VVPAKSTTELVVTAVDPVAYASAEKRRPPVVTAGPPALIRTVVLGAVTEMLTVAGVEGWQPQVTVKANESLPT
jgi:hypothetical protein